MVGHSKFSVGLLDLKAAKHVETHVGIWGNERADALVKAVAKRAVAAACRTQEEQQERDISRGETEHISDPAYMFINRHMLLQKAHICS